MPRYPVRTSFPDKGGQHRAGRHRWHGPAHRRPIEPALPRSGVVAAATAITCGLAITGVGEAWAKDVPAASTPVGSALSSQRPILIGTDRMTPAGGPVPDPGDPVAGLTRVQMDNARHIVDVGRAMGVPDRALVIAVATAMQESSLRNLANVTVEESLGYAHQGVGADHDSVGLFQQRPSAGWGSVRNLMRPSYSAERFYRALLRVRGWQRMSLTRAAQAVQSSAFPDAYARHESRARQVVDAL